MKIVLRDELLPWRVPLQIITIIKKKNRKEFRRHWRRWTVHYYALFRGVILGKWNFKIQPASYFRPTTNAGTF